MAKVKSINFDLIQTPK